MSFLFLLFDMLSRKSIDPEKAVEEILDWVYTGKCNSNLEIVENKESDNIDFIIQNKEVQLIVLCFVVMILVQILSQMLITISSMHSQNSILEDSSFDEVVLLAEVHSNYIFNENCQHEDNILSTSPKMRKASNASYPVLPCKCINKETACKKSEFFKVIAQTNINESFWGKDFLKRRSWFDAQIKIIVSTRRHNTATITEPHGKPKRARTLEYYLPVGGLKARVCKNSFLSTLGLKTDGRVTEFVRYKISSDKSPTIDRRGRWERKPERLVNRVKMREHIGSYKPYVSHYTRKMPPIEGILIRSWISISCLTTSRKHFLLRQDRHVVTRSTAKCLRQQILALAPPVRTSVLLVWCLMPISRMDMKLRTAIFVCRKLCTRRDIMPLGKNTENLLIKGIQHLPQICKR